MESGKDWKVNDHIINAFDGHAAEGQQHYKLLSVSRITSEELYGEQSEPWVSLF